MVALYHHLVGLAMPADDQSAYASASSPPSYLSPTSPTDWSLPSRSPVSDSDVAFSSSSSHSARSAAAPYPSSHHPARAHAAGKAGCWTCRLRRKKCDEEREGDSCKTCVRLRIQCLGWGARRPDWLKEKHAQETYRANIKAQLIRTGMIRGQPRHRRTPPEGMPAALSPESGPGPSSSSAAAAAASSAETVFHPSYSFGMPSAYADPGLSYTLEPHHATSPLAYADPYNALHLHTMHPLSEQQSIFQFAAQFAAAASPIDDHHSSPFHTGSPEDLLLLPPTPQPMAAHPPPPPTADPSASVLGDHLTYFFSTVWPAHFPFADVHNTAILQRVVMRDPRGALAHAVSALASLHYAWSTHPVAPFSSPSSSPTTATTPAGTPSSVPDPANSRSFWDEGARQYAHASSGPAGALDAMTALAGVFLAAYAALSGGAAPWAGPLDRALRWLAQGPLATEADPRAALAALDDDAGLAVRAVMWMDIMSAASTHERPKLLFLYQRLLRGPSSSAANDNASDTASSPSTPTPTPPPEPSLTGRPDAALLVLAEAAALSAWKASESAARSLSARELVRRADAIGALLPEESASDVWCAAAAAYLAAVVDGAYPSAPDVGAARQRLSARLAAGPTEPATADVFPLLVAALLGDQRARARLVPSHSTLSQTLRLRAVVDTVVRSAVDWREAMCEAGTLVL